MDDALEGDIEALEERRGTTPVHPASSRSRRAIVRPWSYPMQELEYFKDWLHSEYWTVHMPEYIKRKYGSKQYQKALPIFASLGVPLLASAKKAAKRK